MEQDTSHQADSVSPLLTIQASPLHPTEHQKLRKHYRLLIQIGSPTGYPIHGWGIGNIMTLIRRELLRSVTMHNTG
jgi:hypothetical protein